MDPEMDGSDCVIAAWHRVRCDPVHLPTFAVAERPPIPSLARADRASPEITFYWRIRSRSCSQAWTCHVDCAATMVETAGRVFRAGRRFRAVAATVA